MKAVFTALICACLFSNLAAQPRSKTKASGGNSHDADYVSALAAADRFFHAWQNHDQETGLLLLSDTAKRRSSPGQLESFFSASEPAYEITQGKKMRSGRYNFAVALFESSSTRRARRRFSEIAVVRTGKNDWAIDKLP
ncbi:MAG TPA: hypothetical protein VJX16_04580 [Terriglobales bacterium]|nr:hypothetical protein [Terriglobales bacterium]